MVRTAISLFSSGGIGDLAIRRNGFDILVSNEKLQDRHALFAFNFPSASAVTGDIWRQAGRIEAEAQRRLAGRDLNLLYATPPCQGMSKNGRGKLLSAVRAGRKPSTTSATAEHGLGPQAALENVPEMANTVILDERAPPVLILDYIERRLGPEYAGGAEVVEFAWNAKAGAFRIHTLQRYDYAWQRADGRKPSDKIIREVIGESIPPAGLQVIVDHLVDVCGCRARTGDGSGGPAKGWTARKSLNSTWSLGWTRRLASGA